MEYGGKTNLRDFVEEMRAIRGSEDESSSDENQDNIPVCVGLEQNIAIGLFK